MTDPANYDIVLNTGLVEPGCAVNAIQLASTTLRDAPPRAPAPRARRS